ncbi:MAG: STAS domain-containing protein [Thiobacillus sp.]|nr:STAS domain-containing protein [Thiobacillus sp.]
MIACENGCCRIGGEVTVDSVGGLLRELQPRLAPGTRLDFSGIERADSAALALIFSAMRQAGGKLAVSGLPADFVTLAELYGVAELLPT